ncbi:MAG: ABC transporter ATP-binding protein [Pirellula sp.]
MLDNVVEVRDLSRRFGDLTALDQISLDVEKGFVYGLVGVNGAGKTTLIKHLLGLLRAKQGTVRVFGFDPASHPVEVLQRIGYLSEEREMPEWMSIDELMRYTAAFHSKWDHSLAQELLSTFRLDGSKKIRNLSKGMRAQAGLVAAVSHRPDLLLLDEPSTGLDPVVRKDILNAIIRTVADDGRTAIFSSHLLDEVEMMSDYVFMFDRGRLVLQGVLDEVKQQHQMVSVRFSDTEMDLPPVAGVLSAERRGSSWLMVWDGTSEQAAHRLAALRGEVTQSRNASLQEIFVARAGRELLAESEV